MVVQFSLGLPPSPSAVLLPRWRLSPAAAAPVLGGSAPALLWPRGAQRSHGTSASAPASASALVRAVLGGHGGSVRAAGPGEQDAGVRRWGRQLRAGGGDLRPPSSEGPSTGASSEGARPPPAASGEASALPPRPPPPTALPPPSGSAGGGAAGGERRPQGRQGDEQGRSTIGNTERRARERNPTAEAGAPPFELDKLRERLRRGSQTDGTQPMGRFTQLVMDGQKPADPPRKLHDVEKQKIAVTKIRNAAKERKWGKALKHYRNLEAEGIEVNLILINSVLSAMATCSRWQEALDFFDTECPRIGLDPDIITFSTVLNALRQAPDVATKWAPWIVNEMAARNVELNPHFTTTLMTVYVSAKQWSQALEMQAELQKKKGGPDMDIVSINAAIGALRGLGGSAWARAVGMLEDARRSGLHVQAPSVLAVLGIMADCSQAQQAMDLLSSVKRLGVQPNFQIFSAAANVCASGGRWALALGVLDTTAQAGIVVANDVLSRTVASACQRGRRWDAALGLTSSLVATAEQRQQGESSLWDATSSRAEARAENQLARRNFATALAACAQGSQWTAALDLLTTMRAQRTVLDDIGLNAAIDACSKAGRWEEASALAAEMLHCSIPPDAITATGLLLGCGRGNQWTMAVQSLGDMLSAAVEPSLIVLNAAIVAVERAPMWNQAISMLASVAERRLAPDAQSFTAAIAAARARCRWDIALELLSEMIALSIPPDAVAYNAVIAAGFARQRWELAVALMEDMARERLQPTSITYTSAMMAAGGAGEWEAALEMLRDCTQRGLQISVPNLWAAMDSCERGSKWELAFHTYDWMGSSGMQPNQQVCDVAMRALRQAKRWRAAVQLYASARVMPSPSSIAGLGISPEMAPQAVDPSISLLGSLVGLDSPGRGGGMAREMKEISMAPDIATYNALVRRPDRAKELLEELQRSSLEPDEATYRLLTGALEEAKAMPLADKLALERLDAMEGREDY